MPSAVMSVALAFVAAGIWFVLDQGNSPAAIVCGLAAVAVKWAGERGNARGPAPASKPSARRADPLDPESEDLEAMPGPRRRRR